MTAQIKTAKTIDWNNVCRVILRATWWLLKTLFKVSLVIGSAMIALIVFLFDRNNENDAEGNRATDVAARRNHGLRGDERNAVGNWIHEDPEN